VALDDGRTGNDCRGEEHEVTVIWSITSGKRQVSMDGREIHMSSSRAGTLDFSWTTKGNHVVKVICHAAAPLSPIPGFRQYDLTIDGQSFFTMPKMFQLGISDPNAARASRSFGGYTSSVSPISVDSGYPGTSAQEEADLRRAIQASLEESRKHLDRTTTGNSNTPAAAQSVDGDLLGFDSPPPMPGVPSYAPGSDAHSVSGASFYSAPPAYNHQPAFASPPPTYQAPPQTPVGAGAIVPMHGPPGSGYYQAPPPTTPGYGSPPPGAPAPSPASVQPYYGGPPPPQQAYPGPPPPQQAVPFGFNSSPYDDPFAPKPPPPPPAQDLASLVMGAYQNGPTPSTPMAGTNPNGWAYSPQENGEGAPPPTNLSMNALVNTVEEEAPVDALTKAMRNLVNFDHIDEPAEGEVKLTMVKKEEAKKKMAKGKSVPLPPVATTLVGTGASLSQIRQVQHGVSVKYPSCEMYPV